MLLVRLTGSELFVKRWRTINLREEILHQETLRTACLGAFLVRLEYLGSQSIPKNWFSKKARKMAQFTKSLVLSS
jgi:hypothetical protein